MPNHQPPKNSKKQRTPAPPDVHRRKPLPWYRPKPEDEDPEALRRVQQILRGSSYRQADQDLDFLTRDEVRSTRLELDYLKAELALRENRICHTIVVFGSTRIVEPASARQRVDMLRQALEITPDNPELQQQLAIAERILAKSHYYDVARQFGELVGRVGSENPDSRLVIMTGGGPGMMEAANRGAFDAGAPNVGMNITLPHEQFPNPYVTPDLCFRFHYFALRKMHFLLRAKALVVFPGGYGTFDELFETLTLIQTRTIHPLPVILVGEEYWRKAFDIDYLVAEGVVDPEDRDLFWYAETAEEIWEDILWWHQSVGAPLLGKC